MLPLRQCIRVNDGCGHAVMYIFWLENAPFVQTHTKSIPLCNVLTQLKSQFFKILFKNMIKRNILPLNPAYVHRLIWGMKFRTEIYNSTVDLCVSVKLDIHFCLFKSISFFARPYEFQLKVMAWATIQNMDCCLTSNAMYLSYSHDSNN